MPPCYVPGGTNSKAVGDAHGSRIPQCYVPGGDEFNSRGQRPRITQPHDPHHAAGVRFNSRGQRPRIAEYNSVMSPAGTNLIAVGNAYGVESATIPTLK